MSSPDSDNPEEVPGLGLASATALVIGSIVGTSVFTLPAVLAGVGTVSLVVLGVVAVGSMLLAGLFGQLSGVCPRATVGCMAYRSHEFGDFAGYVTEWCYWISAWAGNAAIVASWVFYVNALFESGAIRPAWRAGGSPGGVVGPPRSVNLAGIRQMAWFPCVRDHPRSG